MALKEKIKNAKALAIASAEAVYHYRLVAMSIGYTEDQLRNWREADPEFSAQLEQARSRFLKKRIKIAKPEFLLERFERQVFAPPKQEIAAEIKVSPVERILTESGLRDDIKKLKETNEG